MGTSLLAACSRHGFELQFDALYSLVLLHSVGLKLRALSCAKYKSIVCLLLVVVVQLVVVCSNTLSDFAKILR